ncbi:MAG: hypothetical protein FWD57_14670 [Polyangiaceae bacterium]|nr:hypothetical protein [Polyangiaceae bacterium]
MLESSGMQDRPRHCRSRLDDLTSSRGSQRVSRVANAENTASNTISEDVEVFASAAEKYTTLGHPKGRREGWTESRLEGELTGQTNTQNHSHGLG